MCAKSAEPTVIIMTGFDRALFDTTTVTSIEETENFTHLPSDFTIGTPTFELSTTLEPATTFTPPQTNTSKPKPDDINHELLIATGVAIGSISAALCFLFIYSCCRRFVCNSQETVVYNDQFSDGSSRDGRTRSLISLANDKNSVMNHINQGSADSESGRGSSSAGLASAVLPSARTFSFKSSTSNRPLVRTGKTPARKTSPRYNHVNRISRIISSPGPVYLDKRTITADMLNPVKSIISRREMILFKAPSFNE